AATEGMAACHRCGIALRGFDCGQCRAYGLRLEIECRADVDEREDPRGALRREPPLRLVNLPLPLGDRPPDVSDGDPKRVRDDRHHQPGLRAARKGMQEVRVLL